MLFEPYSFVLKQDAEDRKNDPNPFGYFGEEPELVCVNEYDYRFVSPEELLRFWNSMVSIPWMLFTGP